eukprot:490594_1
MENLNQTYASNTNINTIIIRGTPSQLSFVIEECRLIEELLTFVIEEWYHRYCVAIKEDDAEDIEEYDCFLCCGYMTPCKGITYNKLDPRNPLAQRFELAKKNRQMIAKQIQIEFEAPKHATCAVPKENKKPQPSTSSIIDTQRTQTQTVSKKKCVRMHTNESAKSLKPVVMIRRQELQGRDARLVHAFGVNFDSLFAKYSVCL